MRKKIIPNHLAIIMDGNGRWARQRLLPRIAGHKKGVETVRTIVEECSARGIPYLTLYAFSSENWLRPKTEVNALMTLLRQYVRAEMPRMMQHNIKFNVVGNYGELPLIVKKVLDEAMEKTAANDGMVLTLALSYGSRHELIQAAVSMAADLVSGKLHQATLDENIFRGYLYTGILPDPDFLIRTSGEMRLSNFLLWQAAYTELYFTEVNWPDFTPVELDRALEEYGARERRFGRTSDQLKKRSSR